MITHPARAFLVLVAFAGCKHKPAAPKLDAIEVRLRVLGPPALPMPSEAEVQKLAEDAVNGVPGPMRYVRGVEGSTKLVITLDVGWQPGSLRSQVRAQLSARAEDAGVTAIDREAVVEKEHMETMPTIDDMRDHLRRALGLTAASAVAAEELWLGPEDKVRAALTGSDDDLRMDAIGFAAERRDREAVPTLISMLSNKDVDVRDRCVGALADIGDPRAVHPLAELAKFGEWEELPKIIDAVGRIGGDEARAYLDFVAEGHQSPIIQQMAKRALEHMGASTGIRPRP